MDHPAPTLQLIGAGRVGKTLARLWHTQGCFRIGAIATRSLDSARAAQTWLGAGQAAPALTALGAADVWMLAVPDAAIAATAQALAAHAQQSALPPATVFHCAGASGSELLAPLAALGWACASAHCILSFADVDSALQQFADTACALEGDAQACAMLESAFTAIGARCFALRAEDKLLYHAAAVFATNFIPVLQHLAESAWRDSGVPAELLPALRERLLTNAVGNVLRLGPQQALTGPAARGDHAHLARQSACLQQWNPDAARAYDALNALALQMAGHPPR
ncbi:MAG: Rossmann-like and DUF2520 domain-containing protein [Rhodoferax sp.]